MYPSAQRWPRITIVSEPLMLMAASFFEDSGDEAAGEEGEDAEEVESARAIEDPNAPAKTNPHRKIVAGIRKIIHISFWGARGRTPYSARALCHTLVDARAACL